MCCFSRPVESVSQTNIFARALKDGKQFLAYSMLLKAKEDLAMILPLPTPKDAKEDAVRFISLEGYPEFFAKLAAAWPPPRGGDKGAKDGPPKDKPKLKVVEVGAFEASFAPTAKDLGRLDERFRIPQATWDGLPAVKGFGFAVFKLKKGESKVHPMAFEFPRADAKKLFFPTVHIHDGKIHKTAEFDHVLYCQASGGEDMLKWEESPGIGSGIVDVKKAAGLIDGDSHVYRLRLKGRRANEDTWVA
ncbi:MAG: hypothetical protein K2W96_21950 [Gemmataceae bacterium]|nr:hypothetical protein [Gemmataceae bacterium]